MWFWKTRKPLNEEVAELILKAAERDLRLPLDNKDGLRVTTVSCQGGRIDVTLERYGDLEARYSGVV